MIWAKAVAVGGGSLDVLKFVGRLNKHRFAFYKQGQLRVFVKFRVFLDVALSWEDAAYDFQVIF